MTREKQHERGRGKRKKISLKAWKKVLESGTADYDVR